MTSSLSPMYDRFFNALDREARNLRFERCFKPYGKNFLHFRTDRSRFFYDVAFAKDGRFRVGLALARGYNENREAFHDFKADQKVIEQKLGPLSWDMVTNRKQCYIHSLRSGTIHDSEQKLSELKQWALQMLPEFRDVFQPRLRRLKVTT